MTDNGPLPPRHQWGSDSDTSATPEAIRHWIALDYDHMEAGLQELIDNPGYARDGEEIACGPDGDPLPDENVRREAQRLLAHVRKDRAEMLGMG